MAGAVAATPPLLVVASFVIAFLVVLLRAPVGLCGALQAASLTTLLVAPPSGVAANGSANGTTAANTPPQQQQLLQLSLATVGRSSRTAPPAAAGAAPLSVDPATLDDAFAVEVAAVASASTTGGQTPLQLPWRVRVKTTRRTMLRLTVAPIDFGTLRGAPQQAAACATPLPPRSVNVLCSASGVAVAGLDCRVGVVPPACNGGPAAAACCLNGMPPPTSAAAAQPRTRVPGVICHQISCDAAMGTAWAFYEVPYGDGAVTIHEVNVTVELVNQTSGAIVASVPFSLTDDATAGLNSTVGTPLEQVRSLNSIPILTNSRRPTITAVRVDVSLQMGSASPTTQVALDALSKTWAVLTPTTAPRQANSLDEVRGALCDPAVGESVVNKLFVLPYAAVLPATSLWGMSAAAWATQLKRIGATIACTLPANAMTATDDATSTNQFSVFAALAAVSPTAANNATSSWRPSRSLPGLLEAQGVFFSAAASPAQPSYRGASLSLLARLGDPNGACLNANGVASSSATKVQVASAWGDVRDLTGATVVVAISWDDVSAL